MKIIIIKGLAGCTLFVRFSDHNMHSFFEAMYRTRTRTGVAVNPQPVTGSLNRLNRDDVLDESLRYEVWLHRFLIKPNEAPRGKPASSNITRAIPRFALLWDENWVIHPFSQLTTRYNGNNLKMYTKRAGL